VPPIQYWFTGGALGAFLGALGGVSALGYAWYRAAVTELEAASGKAASAPLLQRQLAKEQDTKLDRRPNEAD
jgi:hypothetical protein